VSGTVIDFYLDRFVGRSHALLEGSNCAGWNPAIERAKHSEHLSMHVLNRHRIRRQRAVIHDTRRQPRFMNGELERVAPAHRPSY
jgi:hypothetical protein